MDNPPIVRSTPILFKRELPIFIVHGSALTANHTAALAAIHRKRISLETRNFFISNAAKNVLRVVNKINIEYFKSKQR